MSQHRRKRRLQRRARSRKHEAWLMDQCRLLGRGVGQAFNRIVREAIANWNPQEDEANAGL